MKAEFEINIDSDGVPIIRFRHYNKNSSVEQELLKQFVMLVKDNGMVLQNPSGYADTEGNSHNNYIIKPIEIEPSSSDD